MTENAPASSASMEVAGDWQVKLIPPSPEGKPAEPVLLKVAAPIVITVKAEEYARLPIFNSNAMGGWNRGMPLKGVFAQECSTTHLLDPASLEVRLGPQPDATLLEAGKDYGFDPVWGSIGRLPQGRIQEKQPVFASYRHTTLRLDSVVLSRDGRVLVRQGKAQSAAPLPPPIEPGDQCLGNIWLPGGISRLGAEHLFPILETSYPEAREAGPAPAETLAPSAMAKLRGGQSLKILAWGDSVTDGTYLADWRRNRWQEQFVSRLRARFPQAKIDLVTEAWGGRNTDSYMAEPPGSPHNYREKVLAAKPDLIVSEFVNDAGFSPAEVEQRYRKILADFRAIGAEWIILTPHYVRPDWMGLSKERDIDEDPRPYVKGLRQFAAAHQVALADASKRYGRLWRQGIPYTTLMLNSINHPDARGMAIFADALMALFPAR